MPSMSNLGNNKKMNEIIELIKGKQSEPNQQEITEKILEIVKDLQEKLDTQNKIITKMVAMISKMYQDGEFNKDTFNKLDDFLKPYYDNPYQEDAY